MHKQIHQDRTGQSALRGAAFPWQLFPFSSLEWRTQSPFDIQQYPVFLDVEKGKGTSMKKAIFRKRVVLLSIMGSFTSQQLRLRAGRPLLRNTGHRRSGPS